MCSSCYYSASASALALRWVPNLVCVDMLFIVEVKHHEPN